MADSSTHIPFGNIRAAKVAPIRSPLEYGMQYGGRDMVGPNVPPPVPRQSLAQRVLINRHQVSRYLSRLSPAMSIVPFTGYPAARVLTLIRTSPAPNQTPTVSVYGRPSAGGTMSAPPRFVKALPYPIAGYNPPVYGES